MNFSEPLPVASDNIDLKTDPEPEIRLELDAKRSYLIFESYVRLTYVRMAQERYYHTKNRDSILGCELLS